jgi:molecular chaperone DnaK
VELHNKADGLAYSTERTLEEYADHISEPDRQALRAAVEKTRAAMASGDAGSLASAVDELSALSYQMTEQLYAALGGDEAK